MIEKLNRSVLRAELRLDEAVLDKELMRDEGERLRAYRDTVGKLSIGVGRNLDDVGLLPSELALGWNKADIIKNGITKRQELIMLDNDIHRTEADLTRHLPWWLTLDDVRQRVIVNMCFNMGIGTLMEFKNTLRFMETGQYAKAREGMLASKWARQTGARAKRLADLMSPA